jgi:hypothetical protein
VRPSADELRFWGDASTVALEHCKASFPGTEARGYLSSLWSRYQEQGMPANRRAWLEEELERWFPCFASRPTWAGKRKTPQWPWLDGRPMMFVTQVETPSAVLPTGQKIAERVLYIFCAAGPALVPSPGAWTAKYTVVDVDPNIPW